jgi:sulfotransferase 6B1
MFSRLANMLGEEIIYRSVSSWYMISNLGNITQIPVHVNGGPKTGTTWMVNLVSSLPGFRRVGNFRGDITKYSSLKPGDVVHGHDRYSDSLVKSLKSRGTKTILMIRDPRDQLISRVFHIKRDETHPWHPYFTNLKIDDAITACLEGCRGSTTIPHLVGLQNWNEFTYEWMRSDHQLLCIRYEDLSLDPIDQMLKLCDFINFPSSTILIKIITEHNRFERLSAGRKFWKRGRKQGEEDRSSHFRKGVVGDWRHYFKLEHKERFKKMGDDVLVTFGYEINNDW